MLEPEFDREPALHARLRETTAAAHARLEASLALLDPPLERARFLAVLQGFWGFLQVWEPLLDQQAALAVIWTGRSKLNLLKHDLIALGLTPEELAVLPRCRQAHELDGPPMRLLGSLYVMEGSTLGGQMIDRALANEAWLPQGGLRYFTPYGAQTGLMWRSLQEGIDGVVSPDDQAEVISGAEDMFAVLQGWLAAKIPA